MSNIMLLAELKKKEVSKLFIGSSSDDSIGIGALIKGSDYAHDADGFKLLTVSGWIKCYDVIRVFPTGAVDHVDIDDLV